jgi:hypothetical protein
MLNRPDDHPYAPRPEAPKPPEKPLTLVPWKDIKLSAGPRYLVRNIIPLAAMVVVYGPPKCGKTFWLFDLLMHVALGWDYRGRRVQQGGVVYCLFEGQAHFAARVEAFRQRHLETYGDDVPFVLMPIKLELVKDHPRLVTAIRERCGFAPAVVTLDTLNRSFTGSESSDEAMTAYIGACDAIREALQCAVVIVHHSGLAEGRARGHTALLGAADTQIGVRRDGADNVVATVEYMKDGPDEAQDVCRLEQVEVGTDEDGEPITSCVCVPVEGGPVVLKSFKRSRSDKTFDEAFDEIAFSGTIDHRVHRDGPLVSAVLLDRVETEFKQRYVCEKGDTKQQSATRKKAWQRAIDAAIEKRGYAAEVTKDARQLLWRANYESGTGRDK